MEYYTGLVSYWDANQVDALYTWMQVLAGLRSAMEYYTILVSDWGTNQMDAIYAWMYKFLLV